MTNETVDPVPSTAGGVLRAARQAKGLHIAALAAALKVSPAKLEALESDRISDLPDATFARALAQAVCRHLRIESAPVLAQMAAAPTGALHQVHQGINAPYRERIGGQAPAVQRLVGGPWTWASVAMLAAAGAVMFVPTGFWSSLVPGRSVAPPMAEAAKTIPSMVPAMAPVEVQAVSASGAAVSTPSADTLTAAASAAPGASSPALRLDLPPTASGPLVEAGAAPKRAELPEAVLRTHEVTWVEAIDANGKTLLARTVPPGEMLSLQGERPMRLKIGNAAGVELLDQGKAVDLKPATRENVARFELK